VVPGDKFTVQCSARDADCKQATASFTVTVNPPPQIDTPRLAQEQPPVEEGATPPPATEEGGEEEEAATP
jgi:hypothetical protein